MRQPIVPSTLRRLQHLYAREFARPTSKLRILWGERTIARITDDSYRLSVPVLGAARGSALAERIVNEVNAIAIHERVCGIDIRAVGATLSPDRPGRDLLVVVIRAAASQLPPSAEAALVAGVVRSAGRRPSRPRQQTRPPR